MSACTLLVRCGCAGGGKGALVSDEVSLTLSTSNTQTLFSEEGGGMVVRRLTPRECERLQGFPDDWTKIPYRGKPADWHNPAVYPIDEPITMADLNANTAIGYDMVGTLKVGGDAPSVCL